MDLLYLLRAHEQYQRALDTAQAIRCGVLEDKHASQLTRETATARERLELALVDQPTL
jgi:hypothetical protein